jgi:hypothetical protein
MEPADLFGAADGGRPPCVAPAADIRQPVNGSLAMAAGDDAFDRQMKAIPPRASPELFGLDVLADAGGKPRG